MSEKIHRRQFIVYAAVISTTVIKCAGLGSIASHTPALGYYRKLPANRNPANPSGLVTDASKAGSTIEIFQAIVSTLEKRGVTVDISLVNRVTNLKGYNYVVIGSAIRMGSPLREVIEFVEQNRITLNSIPTVFFVVHLMNIANDEASNKALLAYIDPIRNLLSLQHEAFFTGVFDPKKVSIIDALMRKIFKSPVGDFRDWEAISNWRELLFPIQESVTLITKSWVVWEKSIRREK